MEFDFCTGFKVDAGVLIIDNRPTGLLGSLVNVGVILEKMSSISRPLLDFRHCFVAWKCGTKCIVTSGMLGKSVLCTGNVGRSSLRPGDYKC